MEGATKSIVEFALERAARTPPSFRAEPHGTTEPVRVPIQRDRNSKVLQRIAQDRHLQGAGEGHPLVTDHTEDLRERQLFVDVWEIEDPPQHQPSTEHRQTDQVPVVERLQRLLSPDDMASATTRDEGVR